MNVLVIICDDQRLDYLPYMPRTRYWLQAGGRDFLQARNNISLCAPTRAGTLSGLYSKDHDMFDHAQAQFDHWNATYKNNTLAKWLDDAGYRTGLIGKYHLDQQGLVAKPTGWDTWKKINIGFTDEVGFTTWDGTTSTVINQYQTEWLSDQAATFMGGTEPWFLWLATTNPHWPHGPAPSDLRSWRWKEWPIVAETDVSDKPAWVQSLPALTESSKNLVREEALGMLRETVSLDRMIDTVCATVDWTDTLVFYISDNATMLGEHRIVGPATKDNPYDPCLRVPMLARGPGIKPGTEPQPTTHQDITATITAAAGATAGLTPQAGIDLRDLQNNPPSYRDRAILHEVGGEQGSPADGITTGPFHASWPNRKLVRLPSVRVAPSGPFTYEMYDLDTDPNELVNVAGSGGRLAERNALEVLLEGLLA